MSQAKDFLSPHHKIVKFLKRSRDLWKRKHHDLKMQIKLAFNQVRAVEESRANWRKRAEAAESELQKMKSKKNISQHAAS